MVWRDINCPMSFRNFNLTFYFSHKTILLYVVIANLIWRHDKVAFVKFNSVIYIRNALYKYRISHGFGIAEQRAITQDFLPKCVPKTARQKKLRMVVHCGLINWDTECYSFKCVLKTFGRYRRWCILKKINTWHHFS